MSIGTSTASARESAAEREAAAATYEWAGHGERAGRLREEMRVLSDHLAQ